MGSTWRFWSFLCSVTTAKVLILHSKLLNFICSKVSTVTRASQSHDVAMLDHRNIPVKFICRLGSYQNWPIWLYPLLTSLITRTRLNISVMQLHLSSSRLRNHLQITSSHKTKSRTTHHWWQLQDSSMKRLKHELNPNQIPFMHPNRPVYFSTSLLRSLGLLLAVDLAGQLPNYVKQLIIGISTWKGILD